MVTEQDLRERERSLAVMLISGGIHEGRQADRAVGPRNRKWSSFTRMIALLAPTRERPVDGDRIAAVRPAGPAPTIRMCN